LCFVLLLIGAFFCSAPLEAKRLESVEFGFVQIWNFCPEDTLPISGTIKGGDIKKATPCLTDLAPFSVSGGYIWFAPANYTFEFFTSDGEKATDSIKLKLEKMRWYTIILSLNGKGELVSEVVEDTYSFTSQTTGSVVFYNAIDEWTFKVGISGIRDPAPLPLRERVQVDDLPMQDAKLTVFFKPSPEMEEMEVPISLDFRASKRLAFIPVKEIDGQLSMRLVTLGYNAVEFTSVEEYFTSQGSTPPPEPTPDPTP